LPHARRPKEAKKSPTGQDSNQPAHNRKDHKGHAGYLQVGSGPTQKNQPSHQIKNEEGQPYRAAQLFHRAPAQPSDEKKPRDETADDHKAEKQNGFRYEHHAESLTDASRKRLIALYLTICAIALGLSSFLLRLITA